jgi:hypothetical protein
MRTAATLTLLVAVVVSLVTAPAANAIVNGQEDGNGHPYVGMVFQEGSDAACTGSLVSPTVFVTAGHCIDNFIVNGTGAADVQVGFAADERDYALDVSGTPHLYPGFCSNDLNYHGCPPHGYPKIRFETGDVGVVVLDHPVAVSRYAKLPDEGLVSTLPDGTAITNVGYGLDRAPGPADFGIRHVAPGFTLNGGPLDDEFLKVTGNPSHDMGGMCAGDSGGPVLLGTTDTVLATHSFNYSSLGACTGPDYSFRLDKPEVLGWITSFMAG